LVRYVIPALMAAMGSTAEAGESVALASAVTFDLPLAYFLPVALERDLWGKPWAHPRATNGSGDFVSLIGTDGFIELPPGPATYHQEHVARFYRW
jgi:molybdopterin biosynthesis enzyme